MLKNETHVSQMNLPLLFWFLCVCYIRFSTILYNAVCLLSINLWMITKQITKHEKKRTLHKKHRKNISYCRKCDRTYGIQIYWLFFNSVFFLISLSLVRSFSLSWPEQVLLLVFRFYSNANLIGSLIFCLLY